MAALHSIDPKKLPRDPNNGCNPVFPWQFVRANSIFSVIHRLGGYAAWSDKHPAYASTEIAKRSRSPGSGRLLRAGNQFECGCPSWGDNTYRRLLLHSPRSHFGHYRVKGPTAFRISSATTC